MNLLISRMGNKKTVTLEGMNAQKVLEIIHSKKPLDTIGMMWILGILIVACSATIS